MRELRDVNSDCDLVLVRNDAVSCKKVLLTQKVRQVAFFDGSTLLHETGQNKSDRVDLFLCPLRQHFLQMTPTQI